jgi:hypothetical protein
VATWQDFLREARRFWEVGQTADGPGYHSQAVSNAVHAVIAANDAICLYLIAERAQAQSHAEAARVLRRACRGTALEQEVGQRAQQLVDVLQQKTPSQYYGKQIDDDTAQRVMKQAERFIRWVEATLPQPGPQEPDAGD